MKRRKPLLFMFFISFLFLLHPVDCIARASAIPNSYTDTLQSTNKQSSTVVPAAPTQTSTPSATPSDTPTTTLLPLPVITLVFPLATSPSAPTHTPTSIAITAASNTPVPEDLSSLPPRFPLLFILLFILWIFLALFIIVYLRQFK